MNKFGVSSFLEFEENHNLFDITIDGWRLWPYLRFTTYSAISDSYNGLIRQYRREKPSFNRLLEILKNCTINHPLLRCQSRKFLIFTSPTRVPSDGGYKCFITDDIISALKIETNAAELVSQEDFGHKTPCYTKDILYCDYIEVMSYISSKLHFYCRTSQLSELYAACERIADYIKMDLGFDFNSSLLKRRARTIYIWHKLKKKSLAKLLRKANPQIIVEDCSYSASHMLINELAHEMGIKVVELQHGFISKEHIGYNYKKQHNLSVNPDFLILFSDYWKKCVSYPLKNDRILPLGYPYYDSMKKRYTMASDNGDKPAILVISQHIYTRRLLDDIKRMCVYFDRIHFHYRILYKLHPMEPYIEVKDDPIFKRENVELVDNSKINLYECFSVCNVQIGASSTAIFEGIGFDLKTILLDYPLVKGAMSELIDNRYALIASDGEDAARLITEGMKELKTNINLFNENGSLDRIVGFLRQL